MYIRNKIIYHNNKNFKIFNKDAIKDKNLESLNK